MNRRTLFLFTACLLLVPAAWAGEATESGPSSPALSAELVRAVDRGDLPGAKALVNEGADVTTLAPDGKPLLAVCAENGDAAMTAFLLSRGADPNARDDDGLTAMHRSAIQKNMVRVPGEHDAVLQSLLSAGGTMDLHLAALLGNDGAVTTALDGGADLNGKLDGATPLLAALLSHHDATAALLRQRGATVGVLEAAALGDMEALTKAAHSPDDLRTITGPGGVTVLHVAAYRDRPQVIAHALKAGLNPDLMADEDNNGLTPLIMAGIYGNETAAAALLEGGADPNWTAPDKGFTPLLMGSLIGRTGFVRQLMASGADPTVGEEENGFTPLHFAAMMGNHEVLKALLSADIAPDVPSNEGITPLMLAVMAVAMPEHFNLDELLKQFPGSGATPPKGELAMAAQRDHMGVIRQLLEAGADPHAQAQEGFSAVMVAASVNHRELMKVLMGVEEDENATPSGE